MRYIDLRAWVQPWNDAGPRLEALRRRELRLLEQAKRTPAIPD
jgi:hypothetical protein